MCVTVTVENTNRATPRWDHEHVTIVIGPGLDHFQALRQTRAMLTWLGAPQLGIGATCWCGDPVTIPTAPARVPNQPTKPRQEGTQGAPASA